MLQCASKTSRKIEKCVCRPGGEAVREKPSLRLYQCPPRSSSCPCSFVGGHSKVPRVRMLVHTNKWPLVAVRRNGLALTVTVLGPALLCVVPLRPFHTVDDVFTPHGAFLYVAGLCRLGDLYGHMWTPRESGPSGALTLHTDVSPWHTQLDTTHSSNCSGIMVMHSVITESQRPQGSAAMLALHSLCWLHTYNYHSPPHNIVKLVSQPHNSPQCPVVCRVYTTVYSCYALFNKMYRYNTTSTTGGYVSLSLFTYN